jgi:hypothetical protein
MSSAPGAGAAADDEGRPGGLPSYELIGKTLLGRSCAGRDEFPAADQVVDWLDSTKWSD